MGVRIIKFRAYIGGKMYEFDFNNVGNDELDTYVAGKKIYSDTPIMQWTGMRDRNGVDIYEGDVVKHRPLGYEQLTESIVEYDGGGFYPFADADDNAPYPHPEDCEVIGNVHENPELAGDA